MVNIERIKKKLRNLKQNSSLSEEEINKLAQERAQEEDILASLTFCVNDDEKDFAKNLLENYLEENSVETFADKETLRQLIDLELLAKRLKEQMKKEYDKANPTIPLQMVEQLENLNKQIIELKEKLGFSRKDGEENSGFKAFEELRKKALNYYEQKKGCTEVKCPYCNNLFHLLFDRADYKEIKAIWFKNTQLYNDKLFFLYHEKKITEKDVAEILGVSDFYVNILYEGIFLKELNDSKNK